MSILFKSLFHYQTFVCMKGIYFLQGFSFMYVLHYHIFFSLLLKQYAQFNMLKISKFLFLLWGCQMYVSTQLHLKRAYVCAHEQVVESAFQGGAWLTCMQNVGIVGMFGVCSTRCHLKMGHLGHVKCEYWQKAMELFLTTCLLTQSS